MGKAKRKKNRNFRNNPTGEILEEAELTTAVDKPENESIRNIASQLTSSSADEKEYGCNALAILADTEWRMIIEEGNLVRMVATLLTDPVPGVRHSAVGSLRNLSLVSPEVCDYLVKQDVLTPLLALLSTYNEDWEPVKMSKNEKIDSKTETFIEAVNLLWNLTEANSTASAVFNKENDAMVHLLLKHVARRRILGTKVLIPVLQCLQTVTEDNPPVCQGIISRSDLFTSFLNDEDEDLYARILAIGILINSLEDKKSLESSSELNKIFLTLSFVLDKDYRALVCRYSSILPVDEEDLMDEDSVGESLKDEVINTILAQQTAIEILTNLCCSDEEEEWEDNDSNESPDEEDPMDVEDDGGSYGMMMIPLVIQEAIVSHRLVEKVLSKTSLPPVNVLQILGMSHHGKTVAKMISTLRSRAFLCFSNLVSGLSLKDLTHEVNDSSLFEIWSSLGVLCFKEEENDSELLESATSALRALTQKLCEANEATKFGDHHHYHQLAAILEPMLKVAANETSSSIGVRINIVFIAGSLGALMVVLASNRGNDDDEIIRTLASYLLDVAARDPNLRVVAEALDKIFDMFAEDVTDHLAVKIDLIPKLKSLAPGLKVKVQMMKKKKNKRMKEEEEEEEFLPLIEMAKTNLTRFIKYKSKRPIVAQSLQICKM